MSNLIDDHQYLFTNQKSFLSFLACFDIKKEDISDRYRCQRCKKPFPGLHYAFAITGRPTLEYSYMPPHSYYCEFCIAVHEMSYVKRYPYHDLPLLINHLWVTPQGEQFYRDHISSPMSMHEMDIRIRDVGGNS